MAFAQVYECPECGDVWRGVEVVEEIDCDRDDVEHWLVCCCGRTVAEKYVERDGQRHPVWHALTDDEIAEERGPWGEHEEG